MFELAKNVFASEDVFVTELFKLDFGHFSSGENPFSHEKHLIINFIIRFTIIFFGIWFSKKKCDKFYDDANNF